MSCDSSQYEEECHWCSCQLSIDVPIMCYEDDKQDFTLCTECYWDCEFYKTDTNEDNQEEIQEYIDEKKN